MSRLNRLCIASVRNWREASLRSQNSLLGTFNQPLPLYGQHVRILVLEPGESPEPIQCRLVIARLPEIRCCYEALSYCWGDDDAKEPIFVNDCPTTVREGLLEALNALRKPGSPRNLWVDALCINQNDPNEKGHQVSFMAQIYKSASKVQVWLGQSWRDKNLYLAAFECMSHLTQTDTSALSPPSPLSYFPPSKLAGFNLNVLTTPWFSRVWVVQEAVLASTVTMNYGSLHFSWDNANAYLFLKRLQYVGIAIRTSAFIDEIEWIRHADFGPLISIIEMRLALDGAAPNDLITAVYRSRNRKFTDKRDLVYSALGLADNGADFVVDYTESFESILERAYYHTLRTHAHLWHII